MKADSPDTRALRAALAEGERGHPGPDPPAGVVLVTSDGEFRRHRDAPGVDPWTATIEAAGESARGAALFSSLEPPASLVGPLTQAGIQRLVFACRSPDGAASGLRAAGVQVGTGLEREGSQLTRAWQHVQDTGRPFVTLKAAVTLDGRTATRQGDSKWITSEASRTEVHRMRARTDAILVGVGTVLADDPMLTVRHVEGRDPVRVVLDTHLRTPPEARIHAETPPTWVFHAPSARARASRLPNVEAIEVPEVDGHVQLEAVLDVLARRGIVHLMVEGGATVHGAFLREGLAQRATVFVAPVILGDPDAQPLARVGAVEPMAAALRLRASHARTLGPDVLVEGDLL